MNYCKYDFTRKMSTVTRKCMSAYMRACVWKRKKEREVFIQNILDNKQRNPRLTSKLIFIYYPYLRLRTREQWIIAISQDLQITRSRNWALLVMLSTVLLLYCTKLWYRTPPPFTSICLFILSPIYIIFSLFVLSQ